jgi:predicted glycoside hydrolase/deacetylase ChbG (UPF0249 family)
VRVYIHSDDLAATHHVSKNILESWRAGHLDGFSILANGEAIALVRECLQEQSDRPVRVGQLHQSLKFPYSLMQKVF